MENKGLSDKIGITASSLCMMHCVGTLALAFFLPAGLLTNFIGEGLHTFLAFVVLGAGLFAFVPGYKIHRNKIIVITGVMGILLILAPHILPEVGENFEIGLTLFGGGIMIFSHLKNRSYCQACQNKFIACVDTNGCNHK
ncbi:MAG: MerC domain-containing protein [Nanoarchaeota archaeon]|nr:MerC domain-containing protein [Nanoarchaeota archaeon]